MAKKSKKMCPCGSGSNLEQCCGVFLDGKQLPETAEQLMRSRYTAYALGREQYLIDTWHESTRPSSLNLENDNSNWFDLKIVSVSEGGVQDKEGVVEFVARCRVNGKAHKLREISLFRKENGQWFYLAAQT